MRKRQIIILLLSVVCLLAACGNQKETEVKQFKRELAKVKEKEDAFKKAIDDADLKQVKHLSKMGISDKNKKVMKAVKADIDKNIIPKFEEYKVAASHLRKEDVNHTDSLVNTYVQTVKNKEQRVEQLDRFVTLYLNAVKLNETILDYTRLFEDNRSLVEQAIRKAEANGGTKEVASFKQKLEDNNKALKKAADTHLKTADNATSKTAIDKHIKPLIAKQIKELNKVNIEDKSIDDARRSAVEMYYNLQNYYDTREKAISNSEKLAEIDTRHLIDAGEDIEVLDRKFEKALASYTE